MTHRPEFLSSSFTVLTDCAHICIASHMVGGPFGHHHNQFYPVEGLHGAFCQKSAGCTITCNTISR